MIAIIDYGMGNLDSVAKACRFLGAQVRVTSSPAAIRRATGVIFPGVGAFGAAMQELRRRRLIDLLWKVVRNDKPFLGLCLGLQLLFEESEESPGVKGLGVLAGRVRRLPARRGLKIPHMGWNQIEKDREEKYRVFEKRKGGTYLRKVSGDPLLQGVPDGAFMYFVHSFYVEPHQESDEYSNVSAWTYYGRRFASVYWNHHKIWATQFHPEKSQKWGLRILKNFLKVASSC